MCATLVYRTMDPRGHAVGLCDRLVIMAGASYLDGSPWIGTLYSLVNQLPLHLCLQISRLPKAFLCSSRWKTPRPGRNWQRQSRISLQQLSPCCKTRRVLVWSHGMVGTNGRRNRYLEIYTTNDFELWSGVMIVTKKWKQFSCGV